MDWAPKSWDPNTIAGLACMGRALSQIRAAWYLLLNGYYIEVEALLRGAYEAGALSRLLAHEPRMAEQWLRKGRWFPDRDVRAWFGDDDKAYSQVYGYMSSMTHPTAASTRGFILEEGETYSVRLTNRFEDEEFDEQLDHLIMVALWLCFAIRNAAISEEALSPDWRRALADLASEVAPEETWAHLERKWDEEESRWRELLERVMTASELDAALDADPLSWRNLSRSEED